MATRLDHARIYTPTKVIERGAVVVSDDGIIAYVGAMEDAPRTDGLRLDVRGRSVVPGFVDVHVHGGIGVTFGEPGRDRKGPVRLLGMGGGWGRDRVPVFRGGSGGREPQGNRVRVLRRAGCRRARRRASWPAPGGAVLEPREKGSLRLRLVAAAVLQEVEAVLQAGRGWVRQMTLAPELPGALEVAAHLRAAGVVAAMGHTNTDYETARAALQGNFTHVTHTFNAQRGFGHREPGVFGAILASDDVSAEMIADTIHSHPGAMRVLVRCLGTDRVVLITDALAGAGLTQGQYELLGGEVTVKDGRATLADGTLAGSVATLNQCVRNVHQQVGVPLAEAVKMASLNPARAMGFADRLGSIAVGKDASLTIIDEQVQVYLTMVRGNIVYSRF